MAYRVIDHPNAGKTSDGYAGVPVRLSATALEQISRSTLALAELVHHPDYRSKRTDSTPFAAQANWGAFMSCDFHVETNGSQAKLIEINTNASGALMMADLLCTLNLNSAGYRGQDIQQWVLTMMQGEWQAMRPDKARPTLVAIVDQRIDQQAMRLEFAQTAALLSACWAPTIVADLADCSVANGYLQVNGQTVDMVYNRHTDFYFDQPSAQCLADAKHTVITPHPWHYSLYADKQRLIEWAQPDYLAKFPGLSDYSQKAIAEVLLPCEIMQPERADYYWAHRKQLFFKPHQGYGGKGALQGSKIRRKRFQDLLSHQTLAQGYAPPGVIQVELPSDRSIVKRYFDVRVYSWRHNIGGIVARVFEGQTANFKAEVSGFTWIESCP